jgi:hypothetical protein
MSGMRASRAILFVAFAALLGAAGQASAQPASSGAPRSGATVGAPAGKQSKAAGRPRLSDQAMRLAVARIADASFRIPFDEAPKLTDTRIIGPTDASKTPGPRETHYCASASVGPLPLVFRMASVRFIEQPDGKVQVQTQIFMRSGRCQGDGVKPFPELERARAARRKALGKTD